MCSRLCFYLNNWPNLETALRLSLSLSHASRPKKKKAGVCAIGRIIREKSVGCQMEVAEMVKVNWSLPRQKTHPHQRSSRCPLPLLSRPPTFQANKMHLMAGRKKQSYHVCPQMTQPTSTLHRASRILVPIRQLSRSERAFVSFATYPGRITDRIPHSYSM